MVLGAGFDSRAYRFEKTLPGVRFFELDHPATSARKQEKVREILGRTPANVTFVPIDFNAASLNDALGEAGYDSKKVTCFIWEAVTMYLTGETVDQTLRFIATQAAPGSTVVFDYIPAAALDKDSQVFPGVRRLAFRMALAGEPLLSGLPEGMAAVSEYIRQRGLEVLSDVGSEELTRMYLIGSDGQPDGQPFAYFRIAHARVPAP